MKSVIADTCALLHWLAEGNALPDAVDTDATLLTPSIAWCEIAWKHARGRLPLPMARDAWMAQADELVTTIPVDRTLFLAAVDLDWPHRDPADRVMVAMARAHDAPILTCDRVIASVHPTIWW